MPENVNTSALSSDESTANTLPDSRNTSIKVSNISMVFNMASEQLNSLKEYAIKLLRHELFFEGFRALDNISFEVKKGDVYGIIGTNGSGKSTMLKIIAGVLEPTSGSCEINGNIAPLIELGAGFDQELSARENIYLNGALLGYSKRFISEHFDEIVDFAEIEKFLDMPLKNYSSGMVARIAFAIATVIVPEILVVDEVLAVGDFMFQKKCEDRISELIEKHGVTVLIVSHSNDQVARLCNKAIWIEKGHTRMMGSAASVCRVYGGLGGRTGSLEAEQKVFNALEHSDCLSEAEFDFIAGDDAQGTAVQFATLGWKQGFESVIVVCGATHINAIMAGGLAGALDTPILSTKLEGLSDSVLATLREVKPKTIIFIDCGAHSPLSLDALTHLPWSPKIVKFVNEGDVFDLSMRIVEYPLFQTYWGDTLLLVDFANNAESLAASPLSSNLHSPVITTLGAPSKEQLSRLERATEMLHCKETLIVGDGVDLAFEKVLTTRGRTCKRIQEATSQKTCLALCEETLTRSKNPKQHTLFLASTALSQWPELLGAGPFVAKKGGAILLENPNDLGDIHSCLEFISKRKNILSSLMFIGRESGLSHLDRELLTYAFLAKDDATLDLNIIRHKIHLPRPHRTLSDSNT